MHRAIHGFEQEMLCRWKVKAALLRRPTTWGAGGLSRTLTPHCQLGPELSKGEFQGCTGGGSGLHAEAAQSALPVTLELAIRGSDQHHLDS